KRSRPMVPARKKAAPAIMQIVLIRSIIFVFSPGPVMAPRTLRKSSAGNGGQQGKHQCDVNQRASAAGLAHQQQDRNAGGAEQQGRQHAVGCRGAAHDAQQRRQQIGEQEGGQQKKEFVHAPSERNRRATRFSTSRNSSSTGRCSSSTCMRNRLPSSPAVSVPGSRLSVLARKTRSDSCVRCSVNSRMTE